MEQGSAEWLAARCGKVTASELKSVLAKGKGNEESVTRRNYRIQLVTERLTGQPASSFTGNKATEWGKEQEQYARAAYEALTGNLVIETGFLDHPRIAMFGASPDGLIGNDGGCEIKCPHNSTVHVETLLSKRMPPEHKAQVQGNLLVTGRLWWDFISFDPRMPEHLQLFVQRITPDGEYLLLLESEIKRFNQEVNDLYTQLEGKR